MGDRFIVTAGEYSRGLAGPYSVLQREPDAGPGLASGTTADGIDHHHDGAAARGENAVHFFGGPRFLDTETGQVLTHGK